MRKLRLLDVWIIFPWKQSQSVTPHSLSTDWVLSEYRECTLCVWDWEWLVFSLQGKRDFLFSSLFANPPSSPFKVNTGPRTWSQETCVPVLALKSAGHVIMDRSSRSLTCFCIHKMRGTAEVADVLALHFSGFRILWTRMINLGLSTPLSSTLVCGTAMLLLDVQGTEKEESFFFFFFLICCIPDDLDVMDYGVWWHCALSTIQHFAWKEGRNGFIDLRLWLGPVYQAYYYVEWLGCSGRDKLN